MKFSVAAVMGLSAVAMAADAATNADASAAAPAADANTAAADATARPPWCFRYAVNDPFQPAACRYGSYGFGYRPRYAGGPYTSYVSSVTYPSPYTSYPYYSGSPRYYGGYNGLLGLGLKKD